LVPVYPLIPQCSSMLNHVCASAGSESRVITSYSVAGSNPSVVVSPAFTLAPASGAQYQIHSPSKEYLIFGTSFTGQTDDAEEPIYKLYLRSSLLYVDTSYGQGILSDTSAAVGACVAGAYADCPSSWTYFVSPVRATLALACACVASTPFESVLTRPNETGVHRHDAVRPAGELAWRARRLRPYHHRPRSQLLSGALLRQYHLCASLADATLLYFRRVRRWPDHRQGRPSLASLHLHARIRPSSLGHLMGATGG